VQLSSAQPDHTTEAPPALRAEGSEHHQPTRLVRRLGGTATTSSAFSPACAVGLGVFLALASSAIAATRGFDGLYGQDAYAYFDYATASVRESLLHLRPLEPFFWPPGYPLLVAVASLAVGPVPLAGQLVSLLMGALVTVLTVLLVRELWPEDVAWALLAGALVAVCGQLWQSSVVVMADTTGLALASASAVALVRYARAPHWGWLAAASVALAWATLARWIYGLVAIAFGIYALSLLFDHPHDRRRRLAHAAVALGVAAAILVPAVAQPLIGLFRDPSQPATFAGNFQVYSWSPLNALRHDFFTADGHLAYTQPNGVYYAIAPANLAYFGPLLAVWVLPGLWAARRWPVRNVVLIVGWAAIVYAFHAGAPWQNFRFTLAYLPPLAILIGAGVLVAWRWLASWLPLHWRRPVRLLLAAWVAIGLLVTTAAAVRLVERFVDTKDQELALVHWVQTQTPPGTELFTFGPTLAFRHYSSLPTFDLFDLTPADVRSILGHPAPHYVLVDTASVESQWLNQAPWINYHLMRDDVGLTERGSQGNYTLYQVNISGP
jgi:Dolichyl-phosphate-mannose-protein mannosyltransferase